MATILVLILAQDAELKRALELQEQEKYLEARELFRQIAAKWPDTDAGRKAAARGADNALLRFRTLVRNGPSANRVDVVLTGDGYLLDKQKVLDGFAREVISCFKTENPTTREYFSYFNFHEMNASSKENGVDTGARKFDTVFGATHESGMLHCDYGAVGRMMDEAFPDHDPFAIISIFSATGHSTGGGSMACIAGTGAGPVIHEFGHAFAGLGDEYASGGAVNMANVWSTNDPKAVPWAHWLKDPKVASALGMGVVASGGKFIPSSRCVMNSGGDFCAMCREVFLAALYSWVHPIDDGTPASVIEWKEGVEIWVQPMKPATHELRVEWWLERIEEGRSLEPAGESGRRTRMSATTIPTGGAKVKGRQGARHSVRLADLGLKRGTYAIVVSVRDEPASVVRGLRIPWVLRDERQVMEERRRWIVRVP